MTRNRYRETEVWTDGHIILTGSQCGDEYIVILDPTLEIITNTKIAKGQRAIGHTNGYIIVPLRGFDPVAYGRMRWSQLQAAKMITKNQRGQQDIRTDIQIDIQDLLDLTGVQRNTV